MTDQNYDNIRYGWGKVAFAVVVYSVDLTTYTLVLTIKYSHTIF
jgi:hypothetical protein